MAHQQFDINNEVNCYGVGTIKFAKHANIIAVSFRFNLGFHVKNREKGRKYVLKMITAATKMSNLNRIALLFKT